MGGWTDNSGGRKGAGAFGPGGRESGERPIADLARHRDRAAMDKKWAMRGCERTARWCETYVNRMPRGAGKKLYGGWVVGESSP